MTVFKKKPVVVTGMGVVAPNGLGTPAFLSSLFAEQVEARPIESFDASHFTASFAGEVKDFNPMDYVKKKKKLKLMGPNIRYAVAASSMAVSESGIEGNVEGNRLGVTLGARTRISDFEELESCVLSSLSGDGSLDYSLYGSVGMGKVYPLSMLRNLPNMASAHLSIIHKALGPTDSVTNGASSALQAIGESLRTIQRGDADVMICGGTDSLVNPLDLAQMSTLGILAKENSDVCCRPFDRDACGGMVGEGAAVLILEDEEFAQSRGATVLARVLGFAEGFEMRPESYHDYSSSSFCSRTWKRAMEEGDRSFSDLGALSLMGSSYSPWDRFEAALARESLPNDVPVWSIRPHVGFAGAASSAIDVAAAVVSARDGRVPSTANLRRAIGEASNLDIVVGPNGRRVESPLRLVTSFNRAGAVSALLLEGCALDEEAV